MSNKRGRQREDDTLLLEVDQIPDARRDRRRDNGKLALQQVLRGGWPTSRLNRKKIEKPI